MLEISFPNRNNIFYGSHMNMVLFPFDIIIIKPNTQPILKLSEIL